MFELALAFRAFADERGHFVIDLVGDLGRFQLADLAFGSREILQTPVDDE